MLRAASARSVQLSSHAPGVLPRIDIRQQVQRRRLIAHFKEESDAVRDASIQRAESRPKTRNVLVAVGEPEVTNHALEWALRSFVRSGDKVHLAQCVVPLSASQEAEAMRAPHLVEPKQPSEEELVASWEQQMRQTYGNKLEEAQVPYELHLVQEEAAADKWGVSAALCREAEELQAAVVVIATQSRGGLPELLQGSVANYLAHKCDAPIALLHAGKSAPSKGQAVAEARDTVAEPQVAEPADNNLLVAIDGSEASLQCCSWTLDNMYRPGDTIHLVHVIPCLPATPPSVPYEEELLVPVGLESNVPQEVACKEQKKWMELQMPRFRDIMEAAGANFTFDTIVQYTQDPVTSISEDLCQLAGRLSAKALVMAAHRRSALAEVLFGSVTNSVAHHCDQPIVLLHH